MMRPKNLDAERKAAGDALLEAVGRYVKAAGGNVVVAGPIQLMTFPGDPDLNFNLVVKCIGRKPKPSSAS